MENIIQELNNLIESLEQTKNPTAEFFRKIIPIMRNCKSEKELKEFLEKHLLNAAKITDYGAFNRQQCDLFFKICKIANAYVDGGK